MIIKKFVALVLVSVMTSVAGANLIQNGDFDDGQTGWGHQSAWGNHYYTDGPDTITAMGGWGNGVDWTNTSIWQNTGAVFQANTVYTMDVVWRDPSSSSKLDNIQLVLQDTTSGGSWVDVAIDTVSSPLQDTWIQSTLTFDTASNPAVVGQGIGVSVRLSSPTGGWLHVDSVTLIPEPATMSLLVLGALGMLITKRK